MPPEHAILQRAAAERARQRNVSTRPSTMPHLIHRRLHSLSCQHRSNRLSRDWLLLIGCERCLCKCAASSKARTVKRPATSRVWKTNAAKMQHHRQTLSRCLGSLVHCASFDNATWSLLSIRTLGRKIMKEIHQNKFGVVRLL